jgi:flagellar basal-body rod protein FlgC
MAAECPSLIRHRNRAVCLIQANGRRFHADGGIFIGTNPSCSAACSKAINFIEFAKRRFPGLNYEGYMSIALSIAASGMAAAALRLQVSASNIANALSFGPLPTAKNAQGFPPAYLPLRVDQTDVAGGGTAATVGAILPSYVPIYDPTAPYADNSGMVSAPNVDLVSQLIEQMLARYTFAANAKVAGADARTMGSLLDIAA